MYAGIVLLGLVASFLYEAEFCYRRGGQTVGKQVMRIRIVPLDPAATYRRGFAVKRWLMMDVVSTLLPGFIYVDGTRTANQQAFSEAIRRRVAEHPTSPAVIGAE